MKSIKRIPVIQHSSKIIAALLMCFCLLFLTGANFIVFPQNGSGKISLNNTGKQDEKDPSAPVEEKSSSNNSLTVQEEYLHECHSIDDITASEISSQHKNLTVEKLQTVHFELISPPPDAWS